MLKHRTGYWPDRLDHRDALYRIKATLPAPATVVNAAYDLRPRCPPVYDQANTNGCVAHATAFQLQYARTIEGLPNFVPSRLFVYWNARAIESCTNQDEGCEIRDAIKGLATLGAPPETDWPFDTSKVCVRPTVQSFTDASTDKIIEYSSVVQTFDTIVLCLAAGFPVSFGSSVFAAIDSDAVAATGDIPMPASTDAPEGGHAMAIVGSLPERKAFIIRNSWGEDWGNHGYGTMSYDYIMNPDLTDDLWIVRLVEK